MPCWPHIAERLLAWQSSHQQQDPVMSRQAILIHQKRLRIHQACQKLLCMKNAWKCWSCNWLGYSRIWFQQPLLHLLKTVTKCHANIPLKEISTKPMKAMMTLRPKWKNGKLVPPELGTHSRVVLSL